jgi:two-component sensor histidine kinase
LRSDNRKGIPKEVDIENVDYLGLQFITSVA